MRNLLLRHDLSFGENFHRIYSLGIAFPNLEHLPKRSASDQFEELKVAWGERTFRLVLLKSNLYTHLPAYYFVLEGPELVPLINSVVMDEDRLDLDCTEKTVFRDAIIDVK